MCKTIEIKKSNAIDAYKKADAIGKKLISNLLGKEHFEKVNPMDAVKSFEDALEIIRESEHPYAIQLIKEHKILDDEPLLVKQLAGIKLAIIAFVLNDDPEFPDWDNTQYKWYSWFYMDKPGFRFYVANYGNSITNVGSRLCFNSQDKAIYAAKQFITLWKEHYTK